jgi:hypothetical protein
MLSSIIFTILTFSVKNIVFSLRKPGSLAVVKSDLYSRDLPLHVLHLTQQAHALLVLLGAQQNRTLRDELRESDAKRGSIARSFGRRVVAASPPLPALSLFSGAVGCYTAGAAASDRSSSAAGPTERQWDSQYASEHPAEVGVRASLGARPDRAIKPVRAAAGAVVAPLSEVVVELLDAEHASRHPDPTSAPGSAAASAATRRPSLPAVPPAAAHWHVRADARPLPERLDEPTAPTGAAHGPPAVGMRDLAERLARQPPVLHRLARALQRCGTPR